MLPYHPTQVSLKALFVFSESHLASLPRREIPLFPKLSVKLALNPKLRCDV